MKSFTKHELFHEQEQSQRAIIESLKNGLGLERKKARFMYGPLLQVGGYN